MTAPLLRCAIYTRKSTEEGLEQAFNSLHAQRSACEAYIASQAHEGWRPIKTLYDDGGFSGGSMERPALQLLLEHVRQRRIDVIVVYKVDRLTRSLSDFSKIVEVLDGNKCSFVSVTQSFNTTNSMGRLTLNVLLSFAQFEREVTGERIRDKIAASKKKGMWMGGVPPLGYDIGDRKLVPNEPEAEQIRFIFRRYLELGSAPKLLPEIHAQGIVTKPHVSGTGRRMGGNRMSAGPLHWILRSPVYVGDVRHKDKVWPGEHPGIVDRAVWDAVQASLSEKSAKRQKKRADSQALLKGLIFDDRGNAMSPSHAKKANGARYTYYLSQALLQGRKDQAGSVARISAPKVEAIVTTQVYSALNPDERRRVMTDIAGRAEEIRSRVERVEVRADAIMVRLKRNSASPDDVEALEFDQHPSPTAPIEVPVRNRQAERRVEPGLVPEKELRGGDEVAVLRLLARAWRWRQMLESGEVASPHALGNAVGMHRRYADALIEQSFLSPENVERLLENPAESPGVRAMVATSPGLLW